MSGCTVQRLEAPGLTFLKVSGTVDETFSASQLSGQIRADTILHLGKVTRFSSFGVREWVRLMKDLQGRVKHCILVECSPAVVNQLNVVVDFAAGAHVKSVQLPYACQRCELDKMITVDVDAQRAELLAGTLPVVQCPQCKNPMVFDDLPGSYLAFLRDAAAPEAGSPMSRFIANFEQAAPKLGDVESLPASGSPAPAAAPPPPAVDPTVPPPGMGASPGGGMKWAALAVVAVAVVGGVAYMMRAPPPPPKPPDPVVDTTPKQPPPPPPCRNMAGEESLKLQTVLSAKDFTAADQFITKQEAAWCEETTNSARSSLQVARTNAANEEITLAQEATKKGQFQDAAFHLKLAESYAGVTDKILVSRADTARRTGDCPAVLAHVEALTQQFPTSVFLKQATDYKRRCMAQPAISPQELGRVLKLRQADIDACLKPTGGEGAGGEVELAWTVNTAGSVTFASCLTPAAKENICTCLTDTVKRLHFTEKPGVTARRAVYKFSG